MEKEKRELIIVIPGLKTFEKYPTRLQIFISHFSTLSNIFKPFNFSWLPDFKNYLKSNNRKFIVLHWSRELFLKDRNLAEKKFIRLIKKYQKKYLLKVIAFSLSAEFVDRALKKEKNLSLEKVIFVAGINRKIKTNYKIINLYSPNDKIQKLGEKFLVPLDKSIKLPGKNVKNISVPKLNHEDFLYNSKIKTGKYKGKTTFQLINELLD